LLFVSSDERDIRETERRKSTEFFGEPLSSSTGSPLSDEEAEESEEAEAAGAAAAAAAAAEPTTAALAAGFVPSFDTIDANHDGVIDRHEFDTVALLLPSYTESSTAGGWNSSRLGSSSYLAPSEGATEYASEERSIVYEQAVASRHGFDTSRLTVESLSPPASMRSAAVSAVHALADRSRGIPEVPAQSQPFRGELEAAGSPPRTREPSRIESLAALDPLEEAFERKMAREEVAAAFDADTSSAGALGEQQRSRILHGSRHGIPEGPAEGHVASVLPAPPSQQEEEEGAASDFDLYLATQRAARVPLPASPSPNPFFSTQHPDAASPPPTAPPTAVVGIVSTESFPSRSNPAPSLQAAIHYACSAEPASERVRLVALLACEIEETAAGEAAAPYEEGLRRLHADKERLQSKAEEAHQAIVCG